MDYKTMASAYRQYAESRTASNAATRNTSQGLGSRSTTAKKEEEKKPSLMERFISSFSSSGGSINLDQKKPDPMKLYDMPEMQEVRDYNMNTDVQDALYNAQGMINQAYTPQMRMETKPMTAEEIKKFAPVKELTEKGITVEQLSSMDAPMQKATLESLGITNAQWVSSQGPSLMSLKEFDQEVMDSVHYGRDTGVFDRISSQEPELNEPITTPATPKAGYIPKTVDTGNGLMSSPRPKPRPEGSEPSVTKPSVTNSDGFMDTFIDVIGKAEGTKDHMAQEGQFTYAYGVLPATAKQYGISIDDYPDRKSFAKAVFGEMYKEANNKHPKVFDGMTDAQKSATMLLYINTGKLYNGVQKALEEKDFVQAGKELTNVVHYTERDKNSPDYGKKFSSKGLSARRAKEYNVFAAAAGDMPLVDKVTVTGSSNKPTFNWVDPDGNIVYSFTSSRPLSSKSSMKSISIPKNVTGN